MTRLEQHSFRRLQEIEQAGLLRRLHEVQSPQGHRIQMAGRELVNFSSNDYLGLATHPALLEAAVRAVRDFGAGAGASRLICGSLKPHHELEETLARFKGAPACLTFASGYAAALGTITALVDRHDLIVIDRLVHASIVDAARQSGATLRVFRHNDLNDLERILKWADRKLRLPNSGSRGVLVVTESVFSMDGDLAPLAELVALKERHGAWLMVDEAHGTGLFGDHRAGRVEQLGLQEHVDIQMGTLGKSVGAAGGFVCGTRALIELLVNAARSFVFSTAPVPAAAAAARAGVELIQGSEGAERSRRAWERARQLREDAASPILPVVIGDESKAVSAAGRLREQGFFIPAIRYPTVARGRARLRVTVTANHPPEEVQSLSRALQALTPRPA